MAGYDDLVRDLETLKAEKAVLVARERELHELREALQDSRRQFETLAAISPVGIFRNDCQGHLTYANQRCREITGYQGESLSGLGWSRMLHSADKYRVIQTWHQAVAAARPFVGEYRFQHTDGQAIWVLGQAVPEFDEAGQVKAYVGTLTDITAQKRTEAALQFHSSFERLIASLSTHFINLEPALLDDAIKEALQSIAVFLESDRGLVLLFSEDQRSASCRHEWLGTLGSSLRSSSPLSVANDSWLKAILAGNDVSVPNHEALQELAEPWSGLGLRSSVMLPITAEGRILGAIGFHWTHAAQAWSADTVDLLRIAAETMAAALLRRRTQSDLSASVERFKAIYSAVTDAVFILDQDGQIEEGNPRASVLFGLSTEVLSGSGLGLLSLGEAPFSQDRFMTYIRAAFDEREPQLFEWQCRHSSGRTWWAEIHLQVAPISGVPKAVAVVRDTSRRKHAEEEQRRLETQFQHAQKLESLGVLAGGIAHDFNNLLLAIMGNSEIAALELPPTSPALPHLEAVGSATHRAAELCNQLLAYSGKGKFVVQPLQLKDLVAQTGHLLDISISKKATLEYDYAPGLPPILADSTQVRQILMNLLTNASDALENRVGEIRIATGKIFADRTYLDESLCGTGLAEGVFVFFEVKDTGSGMNEETLRNIFDPFFTTKFTGRGLGLAAVLGIVRAHKGAIRVKSVLGQGTEFRVLFPVTETLAVAEAERAAFRQAFVATGTVLLVDDELFILSLGQKVLTRGGYEVLLAADGMEALELFREHHERISAVVLDLTMPKLGGEETFHEMQKINQRVPVIISSGYTESEITTLFHNQQIAGFIQKPYRPAELLELLRTVIPVESLVKPVP